MLVCKIDRFGSGCAEILQNRAPLKLLAVKVISVMEHIPDTPEGIILESVPTGMAEYYSANLAENVKCGLKENALQCKSNGAGQSPEYVAYDDRRYKIEPNEALKRQANFHRILRGGENCGYMARSGCGRNKDKARQRVYTIRCIANIEQPRIYRRIPIRRYSHAKAVCRK